MKSKNNIKITIDFYCSILNVKEKNNNNLKLEEREQK